MTNIEQLEALVNNLKRVVDECRLTIVEDSLSRTCKDDPDDIKLRTEESMKKISQRIGEIYRETIVNIQTAEP
jgi:hypothetical protein